MKKVNFFYSVHVSTIVIAFSCCILHMSALFPQWMADKAVFHSVLLRDTEGAGLSSYPRLCSQQWRPRRYIRLDLYRCPWQTWDDLCTPVSNQGSTCLFPGSWGRFDVWAFGIQCMVCFGRCLYLGWGCGLGFQICHHQVRTQRPRYVLWQSELHPYKNPILGCHWGTRY